MDLVNLYSKADNHQCEGCTILKINKPFHCWEDYKELTQTDVLFLTESFRYNGWEKSVFTTGERDLFNSLVLPLLGKTPYAISASIKCPDIKSASIDSPSMGICRSYLAETVKATSPKLIIPMGNLAFKMLMKGSGIMKHHGSQFDYNGIPVVPTFQMAMLLIEPKYEEMLLTDIRMALNKFIYKNIVPLKINWTLIKSLEDILAINEKYDLVNFAKPIAIDIETEGLNFLKDKVLSIAMSWMDDDGNPISFCLPVYHKENKMPEFDLNPALVLIDQICSNSNNKKILQNGKFDYKFLHKLGIDIVNMWDTKTMAHLVDENQSTSLLNLVKRYFPENLEIL